MIDFPGHLVLESRDAVPLADSSNPCLSHQAHATNLHHQGVGVAAGVEIGVGVLVAVGMGGVGEGTPTVAVTVAVGEGIAAVTVAAGVLATVPTLSTSQPVIEPFIH